MTLDDLYALTAFNVCSSELHMAALRIPTYNIYAVLAGAAYHD